MTYFDENGDYWGNKSKPLISDGTGRLGARSVKIFADGMLFDDFIDNFKMFLQELCGQVVQL
jgi:hypothetical protein